MTAKITSTLTVEAKRGEGGDLVVTSPEQYAGKVLRRTARGWRMY